MSEASPDSRPLSFRAGLERGLEATGQAEVTSTVMGMVMTASGLTRTILLEVMGEDTTMEDGLVTDELLIEVVAPEGCNRITGLETVEEDETDEMMWWFSLFCWPRFILAEDEQ